MAGTASRSGVASYLLQYFSVLKLLNFAEDYPAFSLFYRPQWSAFPHTSFLAPPHPGKVMVYRIPGVPRGIPAEGGVIMSGRLFSQRTIDDRVSETVYLGRGKSPFQLSERLNRLRVNNRTTRQKPAAAGATRTPRQIHMFPFWFEQVCLNSGRKSAPLRKNGSGEKYRFFP